jgi:hypothetical protein
MVMRALKGAFFCALVILMGCASISEKGRMNDFGTLSQKYERALLLSDFRSASKFLDPAAHKGGVDYRPYGNVKIADYRVTNITVSEDYSEVTQNVELQYFLLDRNILRTLPYKEIWRYDKTNKVWLLQTGLPNF